MTSMRLDLILMNEGLSLGALASYVHVIERKDSTMAEFGIFTDEGLIEDGFFSVDAAQARLESAYSEDGTHVAEICHDHEGQAADTCETCNSEDEGE